MSDDGLVKVEYTIDGDGKLRGGKWEAEVDEYEWDGSYWAKIAEQIAADHYEDEGPLDELVEIAMYRDGKWVATVRLVQVPTIVTYQAIEVDDSDDEED